MVLLERLDQRIGIVELVVVGREELDNVKDLFGILGFLAVALDVADLSHQGSNSLFLQFRQYILSRGVENGHMESNIAPLVHLGLDVWICEAVEVTKHCFDRVGIIFFQFDGARIRFFEFAVWAAQSLEVVRAVT